MAFRESGYRGGLSGRCRAVCRAAIRRSRTSRGQRACRRRGPR